MALVVGENSYVSLVEADEYFSTRYNSNAWDNCDDPTKEVLLISATRALDNYGDWKGEKTDDNQYLEFPRYPDTEVPEKIKMAQYEVAIAILENGSIIDEREANLKEMKVDIIQFKFGDTVNTNSLFNSFVISILSKYQSATVLTLVRV